VNWRSLQWSEGVLWARVFIQTDRRLRFQ
jgi:hypothetical protein